MQRVPSKFAALLLVMLVVIGSSACSSAPPVSNSAPTNAPQPTTATEPTVAPATAVSSATAGAEAAATSTPAPTTPSPTSGDTSKDDAYAAALSFNNAAWQYDADNDVYWQIGVVYAATPAAAEYESLGIYVPGVYLTATANGDGSYTATPNAQGERNGFSAQTAPIVFPVNTGGYSAQSAPTAYSYDGLASYLEAGFIYVYSGARGRANGYDASGALSYSGGAPWGVTDFKAAIRFVRYNQAALPGNADNIFVFGMSGGGAQSTLIGASGDSELYRPYLESIGAAMYDAEGQAISDAVAGVMAWCPITSLDYADQAYEWNMGQYVTTDTRAEGTWTAALSKDLAGAYADYINALGITDSEGNVLSLTQTAEGIYTAGSYYDYLFGTVQTSLNNFLADTTFPYTETVGGFAGADGGFAGGGSPAGGPPPGAMPGGPPSGTATTYQTVQEYIDALNQAGQWVTYDAATNTATITSLADFVKSQKLPSKSVGAFDRPDRGTAENDLFGNDENDSLHFNAGIAQLLADNQANYAQAADWDASVVEAYATDVQALDALGNSMAYRIDAYNPMYYLLPFYDGYQQATIAPHWRIRTGIKQGDTANTVELNLALALESYAEVETVDFATVWGQSHVLAERTGNATDNFIAWVSEVAQK